MGKDVKSEEQSKKDAQYKEAIFNDFVNRSFRDEADREYIAARICYRHRIPLQFLWHAHQAMEKYLKAILLYNRKNTKNLSHNLAEAYKRVQAIEGIEFDLPDGMGQFIERIDSQGTNRYLDGPYFMLGDDILDLDGTIWNLRRLCWPLKTFVEIEEGEDIHWNYRIHMAKAPEFNKAPHKFQIFGGFLEDVLRDNRRYRELRPQLIWHNFYYGKVKKHIIKKHRSGSSSGNSTLDLHPEIFPELDKLVFFSKEVRERFNGNTQDEIR